MSEAPALIGWLKKHTLLVLLCFGFLHGLAYVFLEPPWEHYDEPGHYEYAWMMGHNRGHLSPGGFDNQIREQIQRSMRETGFMERRNLEPPVTEPGGPVWIGISQVGDPPVYYFLAGQILWIFNAFPITVTLYALRVFSLIFFLITIWMAWLTAGVLFAGLHWRWLLPFMVAALPPLADLMSALNNDPLAIAYLSVFIWLALRGLRKGLTWKLALPLVLMAAGSYYIKASVWVSIPALGLLLILCLPKPWLRWGALAAVTLGLTLLLFRFDDAALWMRETRQDQPMRVLTEDGWALRLQPQNPRHAIAYQAIPAADLADIRGETVTVGVRAASQGSCKASVYGLRVLRYGNIVKFYPARELTLTSGGEYAATQFDLPEDAHRVMVALVTPSSCKSAISFDDVTLVKGAVSADELPSLVDSPRNLVRNPGMDTLWPRISPTVLNFIGRIDHRFPDGLRWMLYSLDVHGNRQMVTKSVKTVFNSFWGKFSWGQVGFRIAGVYYLLYGLTGAALTGLLIAGFRRVRRFTPATVFWIFALLSCAFVYAWFTTVSMGSFTGRIYLPVARFAYPCVVLVMTVYCAGLMDAWHGNPNLQKGMAGVLVFLMLALDILAFVTVWSYYS